MQTATFVQSARTVWPTVTAEKSARSRIFPQKYSSMVRAAEQAEWKFLKKKIFPRIID